MRLLTFHIPFLFCLINASHPKKRYKYNEEDLLIFQDSKDELESFWKRDLQGSLISPTKSPSTGIFPDFCIPGFTNCCTTMLPPSFPPPKDSTCWKWFIAPANGLPTPEMESPQLGCDYLPCQKAVCACDPYCCDIAWDLSCRGYDVTEEVNSEGNYFVDNCSAKNLCCEPDSFPTEAPAFSLPAPSASILQPVAVPVAIPVPIPVLITEAPVLSLPAPTATIPKPVAVPVAVPVAIPVPIPIPIPVLETNLPTKSPKKRPTPAPTNFPTPSIQILPRPTSTRTDYPINPTYFPTFMPTSIETMKLQLVEEVLVPIANPIPVAVPIQVPVAVQVPTIKEVRVPVANPVPVGFPVASPVAKRVPIGVPVAIPVPVEVSVPVANPIPVGVPVTSPVAESIPVPVVVTENPTFLRLPPTTENPALLRLPPTTDSPVLRSPPSSSSPTVALRVPPTTKNPDSLRVPPSVSSSPVSSSLSPVSAPIKRVPPTFAPVVLRGPTVRSPPTEDNKSDPTLRVPETTSDDTTSTKATINPTITLRAPPSSNPGLRVPQTTDSNPSVRVPTIPNTESLRNPPTVTQDDNQSSISLAPNPSPNVRSPTTGGNAFAATEASPSGN